MLAKKIKYISVTKNEFTGEMTKEFVPGAVVLYVYANNIMQAFRPSKGFVISLLKDKEPAINTFIEANKINLRKIPDLIRLFNYYMEQ